MQFKFVFTMEAGLAFAEVLNKVNPDFYLCQLKKKIEALGLSVEA